MKAVFLAAAILPLAAVAGENQANASWSSETATVENGNPLRTAIRMQVREGWHTYWENPGEGGMPLSIEAELPEGWAIGPIQYPVPKRFMTGDLPGFGYEGKIIFPITVTPPVGFSGSIPAIKATLSWLTCNDETCVPGEAELTLSKHPEPELIGNAYDALPKPMPGAIISLTSDDDKIIITMTHQNPNFDPTTCEIFPVTRNIIDPSSKPHFTAQLSSLPTWVATAKKSEYLDGQPTELTLVLSDPEKGAWKVSARRTAEK